MRLVLLKGGELKRGIRELEDGALEGQSVRGGGLAEGHGPVL